MRPMLVATRGGFACLSGITVLAGAVLVLVAFLVACCGLSGASAAGAAGSGDTAPDFQVTTLAGDQASLSLYRGKPLVLAFMASW
jgi:hypothetical protein